MRVAIQVAPSGAWPETVDFVREAERLGVEVVWVPEAWAYDAAAPLGFLAAVTEHMLIGSGIFQVDARSAVMTAQTAASLVTMTGGRFLLGLGVSGPQVIEGLHGRPFARPLQRMRETIEVVRLAVAGDRVEYAGETIRLPRVGGEGKALRLGIDPIPHLPIYVAALSPRMLALTGELADGWLGTSFVPEQAEAYFSHLREGASAAVRSWEELDRSQGAEVAFGDDVDAMVAGRKKGLAFSLGGMGSPSTNFYNDAYARQGWAEVVARVRDLWTEGRREEAAAAVPDAMVLQTTLIGTEAMVRERIRLWRDTGITTLRVYPAGASLGERLATLGRAVEIVAELRAEGQSAASRAPRAPAGAPDLEAVVRGYNAACSGGSVEAVVAFFTEDAVIYDLNHAPVRGRAVIGEFWDKIRRKWEGATWEADRVVVDGTNAVAEWTMRGARRGEPFAVRGVDVFAFRGGLIEEIRQYWRFDPDHLESGLVGFPY